MKRSVIVNSLFGFGVALVIIMMMGCALTPLHKAVNNNDIKTVTALLDEGANENEECLGYTALYSAAWYGQTEIARLLIDRGADVNLRSHNFSPLHAAVTNGHADLVRLLIDRGADISISSAGETPLNEAKREGHTLIIRMLQEAEEELYQRKYARVEKPSSSVSPEPSATIRSDVDDLPQVEAKPNKNAYAIVIGIEEYRQKLPKADFAVKDAVVMTEYLEKIFGYPQENIVTLLNGRALKSDLEKYLGKWLPNNVEKDSSVFIYYSGHGAPNPKTGDAFLVPYDGDPSFIEETGYPLKRLYSKLDRLSVKEIIVVLDSCFSGAGGRSVLAKGARPLVMNMDKQVFHSDRIAILSASSGGQISSTYEEKGHGLFTYFFLKGIKDGNSELGALYNYLKPKVERIARKTYNNEQTPQLIAPNKTIIVR
jgi:Caspase domain/Ankyrin repeats (3 copies)/Ankyrin repeat